MTGRKILGLVLVIAGMVALLWGGVFWTDRDTVVDAGPLQIATEERKGFPISPVLGGVALVGGIVLLVMPGGRRVHG